MPGPTNGFDWDAWRLLPIDKKAALTPIEWLIDGWLERQAIAVLYGPSSVGKTFFALHASLCITAGRTFFGSAARRGVVAYITGEGGRGIGRRVLAWMAAQGVTDEGHFFLSSGSAQLTDRDFLTAMRKQLDALPAPPDLVVFDTVAKTFGLIDESNEALSQALGIIQRQIVEPYGATALALHHTGKNARQGPRGGSSLECDADALFEMEVLQGPDRDKNTRFDWAHDLTAVRCKKMRDCEPPASLCLQATQRVLGGTPGRPIASLTFHKVPFPPAPKSGKGEAKED